MTTMFAQIPAARDLTIEAQLAKLGAVVHHITYGPGHRFDPCTTCGAVDAAASCTVYGVDSDYRECCTWCVVSVADDFSSRLIGRFDEIVVEIGTVEAPRPSVVLDTADRSSDLADPRCEQHDRTATFAIQTEQHERQHYCDRCAPDGIRAALMSGSFIPASLSAVDLDAYRMAVAA